MPGSCSSGLRSRPSGGGGNRRANGFDVSSMNSRKPTLTRPITPSTRATSVVGQVAAERASPRASSRRASASTAAASLRASPTSRRSGSAAAAASSNAARRCSPRNRWSTKRYARQPNAIATSTNCARAAGRASAISAASRRRGAEHRHDALRERDEQREDQREMAELGNHRVRRPFSASASRIDSWRSAPARSPRFASGGM